MIIDMEKIVLSKALDADTSPAMLKAENSLIKYAIPAAHKLGSQAIWLNWGLTKDEIDRINPAEVRALGFRAHSDKVGSYSNFEVQEKRQPQ